MSVDPEPMVHGTLMAGFAQACINLKIVAGRQVGELLADLDVSEWYPLRRWVQLEQMIGRDLSAWEPGEFGDHAELANERYDIV